MGAQLHGPSALCSKGIRRLNFEMHLIQHGLVSHLNGVPFLSIWLVAPVLAVLWGVYWIVYPALVALLIAFLPISWVLGWGGRT